MKTSELSKYVWIYDDQVEKCAQNHPKQKKNQNSFFKSKKQGKGIMKKRPSDIKHAQWNIP